MGREVWKAEYNGHTIEVFNSLTKSATLEIDGEEQSKSKELITPLFMGKLPEGEDVMAVIESKAELEAHFFVGNRVKLQSVDKGSWKADYNGHTITIKNKLTKAVIEIDGAEQDKTRSLIDGVLKGKLPEGEDVMAFLDSELFSVDAYLIIGNEIETKHEKL